MSRLCLRDVTCYSFIFLTCYETDPTAVYTCVCHYDLFFFCSIVLEEIQLVFLLVLGDLNDIYLSFCAK